MLGQAGYRQIAEMRYIDEFLFRGYEYLSSYVVYQAGGTGGEQEGLGQG